MQVRVLTINVQNDEGDPGRLDYIFVGSPSAHADAHCRIRTAELAFDQPRDGRWASDHFGVLAELDVGVVR